MGEDTEKAFVAVWCACIAIFAARKYTQPVNADIGDKSVFIFNALSEAEQGAWTQTPGQRYPSQ
jgi:hypothetical protein